jgi:hypothetical protein
MAWLRPHVSFANAMSIVAVFIALGGGAYALSSVRASDSTIRGCFKKKKGTLRIVAAGKGCKKSERAISWNQQGPAGQQGGVGPQGATGPAGSGSNADTLDGLNSTAFVRNTCAAGKTFVIDACIENAGRTAKNWANANAECQTAGARLPNVPELQMAALTLTLDAATEWTSVRRPPTQDLAIEISPSGWQFEADPTLTRVFRCVTGTS